MRTALIIGGILTVIAGLSFVGSGLLGNDERQVKIAAAVAVAGIVAVIGGVLL